MRRGLAILILFGLLACSSQGPAPVSDRYQSPERSPTIHRVTRGDTLFSIAFRYGTTVEKLAAINDISAPYTIYLDQRLKLRGQPVTGNKKRTDKTSKVVVKSAPKTVKATSAVKPKPSTTSNIVHKDNIWYWPLAKPGKLTAKFKAGSDSNKGIDIVEVKGTPVLATRAGKVVYAGSSLPGYGNLLIIKHGKSYLSAYAHNDRLLVKEGDAVVARQPIARLGSTSTPTPKLHFEIRRDGKPIDPLSLLRRAK